MIILIPETLVKPRMSSFVCLLFVCKFAWKAKFEHDFIWSKTRVLHDTSINGISFIYSFIYYSLHRFTNYYYPRFYTNNSSTATISVHIPWILGLLLHDANPSELERLDKPCATSGHEHINIIFSVNNTSQSSIFVLLSYHSHITKIFSMTSENC